MKGLELFSQKHVKDVLQNVLFSDKSKFSFTVECTDQRNFKFLNIKSDGADKTYFLMKMPENLPIKKQQKFENSKVIYPHFIIKDNMNETYGAFKHQKEMEDFLGPEQNNYKCLKLILKTLAEHQASVISTSDNVEKPSEYSLNNITDPVISLNIFKDLDEANIKETIKALKLSINKLFDFHLLVQSIGCPFAENVFVNQNLDESRILAAPSTKVMPPVYDALLYIFALSNEEFRQRYFEDLILYYFNVLKKSLQNLRNNATDKLTKRYSEEQVRVLLPLVKFTIASSLLSLSNSLKLQEIFKNIRYFLKYPFINQEDVYEATKTKFGSSDYELIEYTLKCLSVKNGHLGEYYHLDIKVNFQEKQQDLQLFLKVLIANTAIMQEILNHGPAKKEDFFYKTLMPLYAEHGLESLLDFAPKCYLSRDNWLLVLDDLSREGYVSLKPNVVLNYEGLRATIENLAKFHAATLILEETLSEKLGKMVRLDEDYGEFFVETILLYGDGCPMTPLYDSTLKSLYYIMEKVPEVIESSNLSQEEIKARIKEGFLSVFSRVKKSDSIRNVINHGDMYVGNMLFKFGEDKTILKAMLIDFQLLRYAPSSYELLFFLYENSTKEIRDKYFKKLIEDYYQFITDNIRKFNFNPDILFPRKAFDQNLNHMKLTATMGAFMYAHLVHLDPELRETIFRNQEKFDYYMQHKSELIDLSWSSEHYRNMLKGLVKDMVDIIKNDS